MLKRAALIIALVSSSPAMAVWNLTKDDSSLHFLTTKNAQITEVHSFKSLAGAVSDTGELSVEVDLGSVDTLIPIRNTRMKEMLFDTITFPKATFSATLNPSLLNVPAGKVVSAQVSGTLDLHGVQAPVTFDLKLVRTSEGQLVVSTVKPTIIHAKTFSLESGVEALRNIAGLKSITTAVPVTFSVTFTQ